MFGALGVSTINLIEELGNLRSPMCRGSHRRANSLSWCLLTWAGSVPFRNAPVVQQGINAFQAEVGTIWDWPD